MREILFGTPLFSFEIEEPEMNEKISQLLLKMKSNNETLYRGDHENWHSDWLHAKQDTCLKKLADITNMNFDKVVSATVDGYKCKWTAVSWGIVDEKK